jgi:hypothetical protein
MAFRARAAGGARNRRIDGHAPAVFEAAPQLVARHEWTADAVLVDAAFREPVDVGAAHADRAHPDEQLARSRARAVLVLQSQVGRPVKSRDPHGRQA